MGVPETKKHFLLECPWYMIPRIEMYANLFNIPNLSPINEDILLYGDKKLDDAANLLIVNQVQKFIITTHRFIL
jgi:hypothetical protein